MDLHMRQFDGVTFGMEAQNPAAIRTLKKKVYCAKVTPKGLASSNKAAVRRGRVCRCGHGPGLLARRGTSFDGNRKVGRQRRYLHHLQGGPKRRCAGRAMLPHTALIMSAVSYRSARVWRERQGHARCTA